MNRTTLNVYIYNLFSKIYDIKLSRKICNYSLTIPLSHRLPEYLELFPNYSQNLGRIVKIVNEFKKVKCIDVGANIGDSVSIIKSYADVQILCIEGNDIYTDFLKENVVQFSGVEVECSFLGKNNTNYETINEAGTTRLNKVEMVDGDKTINNFKTLETILEEHTNFSDFNFLKIDTDGFDNTIIKGSIELIAKNKPVIFFEYDPYFLSIQGEEGIDIFEILKNIGYESIMFYDNFGEYILSCSIDDDRLIKSLHNYIVGKKGSRYYDLCIFHGNDKDLFDKVDAAEIKYFCNFKNI